MQNKMPWLKDRLREVGKTPASLARELRIQPPRVYEMIGGRRHMQPDEIKPTAHFLDWGVETLLEKLPPEARILLATPRDEIPVLATTRDPPLDKKRQYEFDCVLTGETQRYVRRLPAFEGRKDICCLYLHSLAMMPWRVPGELIVFEKERPPQDSDHVVILIEAKAYKAVVVRQLVRQTGQKLWLRRHNPSETYEFSRRLVSEMYRVLTWDDCVR